MRFSIASDAGEDDESMPLRDRVDQIESSLACCQNELRALTIAICSCPSYEFNLDGLRYSPAIQRSGQDPAPSCHGPACMPPPGLHSASEVRGPRFLDFVPDQGAEETEQPSDSANGKANGTQAHSTYEQAIETQALFHSPQVQSPVESEAHSTNGNANAMQAHSTDMTAIEAQALVHSPQAQSTDVTQAHSTNRKANETQAHATEGKAVETQALVHSMQLQSTNGKATEMQAHSTSGKATEKHAHSTYNAAVHGGDAGSSDCNMARLATRWIQRDEAQAHAGILRGMMKKIQQGLIRRPAMLEVNLNKKRIRGRLKAAAAQTLERLKVRD